VSEPVVTLRDVAVKRGRRTVLEGVDLELARGETVAIIGPNGAGKSTLIQAIAGLMTVERGSIERKGRVAAALQSPALARRTAVANVELALSWWGVRAGTVRRERARAALAAIRAEHLASRPARSLSGGEARRVHLARALALDAEALLLDEPFAGLDPSTRADLLYESADVLRDASRATVVVVHDRAEARALADRVVVLIDGRVRAEGQPGSVFDDPPDETVAVFLGYEGVLECGATRVRYRPSEVHLDDAGPVTGHVSRAIPLEHGVRVEVATANGSLVTHASEPGPTVGSDVRVRLDRGASFGPDGVRARSPRSA
jgi:ABC-type sulfate/molybdate transport systems ATPase subunit